MEKAARRASPPARCLVSDQVGLADFVEENGVGLVLPLDPDAWAEALDGLRGEDVPVRWDPARISEVARASFSIENVARKMLREYERILEENKELLPIVK